MDGQISLPQAVDIMSAEVEWIALGYENGKPARDFFANEERAANFFAHGVHPHLRSSRFPVVHNGILFLYNGGKVHFDTGFHPEYAGPEGRWPRNAARYEKAGEWVMQNAIERLNQYWKESSSGFFVRLYKSNLDKTGDSQQACGTHTNFNLIRCMNTMPQHILNVAGAFLVSTLFFTGNGRVVLNGKTGKMQFEISQRASLISSAIGGTTTQTRPIINTRDEPHADQEKYRRLHIILFDSVLAEPAIFLRFGATALVFEMVQNGYLKESPFPILADDVYVKALHFFSEDPTLRKSFKFSDGNEYTAVDLQEMYFERAVEYCHERKAWASAEDQASAEEVLHWWNRAIEAAKSPCPHEALARIADWAAKFCFIEQDGARRGYDFEATPYENSLFSGDPPMNKEGKKALNPTVGAHVKAIDLQFSENSSRGVMRTLMREGFIDRVLTDGQIEAVRFMPLANTRAYPRAVYLRRMVKHADGIPGATLRVDWTYVSLLNFSVSSVPLVHYGPMGEPHDARIFSSGAAYAVLKPPENSPTG